MASSSTATPETLITLKVSFDGVTRRFKLPLRELVVSSLEDKVSYSRPLSLQQSLHLSFIFVPYLV